MKKCCCFIILCQLIIGFLAAAQSWADDSRAGSSKASLRSAALKTPRQPFNKSVPVASSSQAVARANATTSGLAIVKEISRQRMQLSPQWYLEGDYNYYYGFASHNRWSSVDRPEIYAVYHMFPFEILTPYFRFGADWLRQQDSYLYSHSRPQNDTVNLHLGGGLRFGLAKHVAVDFDMKYGISSGGSKNRNDSWGGNVGVLFYF